MSAIDLIDRPSNRRPTGSVVFAALVTALALPAHAGTAVPDFDWPGEARSGSANPPTHLEPLLDDLDSPDIGVREEASRRMKADDRITDAVILDYLESNWSHVSPEQISRLKDAARQRFVANPGAIGIEFAQGGFAIVGSVKPEAPVYGILRAGDRIITFNGRRLPETRVLHQEMLFEELSRCKAGQIVQVRIERDSEEIDVEFRLADPNAIPGFEGYVDNLQGYLQDRWQEICEVRLPPCPFVMIDMDVLSSASSTGAESTSDEMTEASGTHVDNLLTSNALATRIRERIGEISIRIAEVVEAQDVASPGDGKAQYQQRYLVMRSELARLNARLRMLDAMGNNRRRR